MFNGARFYGSMQGKRVASWAEAERVAHAVCNSEVEDLTTCVGVVVDSKGGVQHLRVALDLRNDGGLVLLSKARCGWNHNGRSL